LESTSRFRPSRFTLQLLIGNLNQHVRMSNPLSKLTKRLSLGGKKSTTSSQQQQPTASASTSTTAAQSAPSAAPAPAVASSSTPKPTPDYSVEARSLNSPKDALRKLYPQIEPYDSGMLDVGDSGHRISWEWSGKKDGWPGESSRKYLSLNSELKELVLLRIGEESEAGWQVGTDRAFGDGVGGQLTSLFPPSLSSLLKFKPCSFMEVQEEEYQAMTV